MKVVYYDGSTLECNSIEIVDDGKTLIADDTYIVPVAEAQRIIDE